MNKFLRTGSLVMLVSCAGCRRVNSGHSIRLILQNLSDIHKARIGLDLYPEYMALSAIIFLPGRHNA